VNTLRTAFCPFAVTGVIDVMCGFYLRVLCVSGLLFMGKFSVSKLGTDI